MRKLLKKLKDKIYSFFYALPFAMKAGDEILTTSQTNVSDGAVAHQKVHQKGVLNDLLRGEVTQEVEELRWEMFKSEEMANNYQYVGNGQSIKIDENQKKLERRRKKFVQFNIDLDYNLAESLNMLDGDVNSQMDYKTRKLFKIDYDNPCVRFKLENYSEKVEVNMLNENQLITKFYVIDDLTYKHNVPFVNYIKKIMMDLRSFDADDHIRITSYLKRCELVSEIKSFAFTTFNATNNVPNGIEYNFSLPSLVGIEEDKENGYVIINFEWRNFEGGQLLSEKLHSKTAEEKFKNKTRREGYVAAIDFSGKEKNKKHVKSN